MVRGSASTQECRIQSFDMTDHLATSNGMCCEGRSPIVGSEAPTAPVSASAPAAPAPASLSANGWEDGVENCKRTWRGAPATLRNDSWDGGVGKRTWRDGQSRQYHGSHGSGWECGNRPGCVKFEVEIRGS